MSWYKRLLSQNRPVSTRVNSEPVIAYYWNGGRSSAQPVREITTAGCYVVTEDRWYLGTCLRLLLQTLPPDSSGSGYIKRSICVEGVVVRHGEDGVAFAFIQDGSRQNMFPKRGLNAAERRKEISVFVRQVRV
jgi:hypothetical protein